MTVLTSRRAVPAAADRRTVTVYELAGPDVPFWGYAYPERLTGGTVFLPGRLREDGTVEVGRTMLRGAYQPGVRAAARRTSRPGRTVLVGDAATDPVAGHGRRRRGRRRDVTSRRPRRTRRACVELGLDAASATVASRRSFRAALPPSFTLSSAQPSCASGSATSGRAR